MNNQLLLPLRAGKYYTVVGGSFYDCPATMIGVKMAREINEPCHINIPTLDFKVPDTEVLDAGLYQAVRQLTMGHPLYVGCMAGKGRTGLFLAVLAKAFGIDHPVEYVREHYYPHAVETAEQYRFVEDYQITFLVRYTIWMARAWSYLPPLCFKENLTNAEIVS